MGKNIQTKITVQAPAFCNPWCNRWVRVNGEIVGHLHGFINEYFGTNYEFKDKSGKILTVFPYYSKSLIEEFLFAK